MFIKSDWKSICNQPKFAGWYEYDGLFTEQNSYLYWNGKEWCDWDKEPITTMITDKYRGLIKPYCN